jgi:hypothetical protein
VLDPAHIAPSRSDANSNGHFPVNNHAPVGTPRGFNLANMPAGFNMSQFQAFLSQSGLSSVDNPDERHAAGVQRRQGGRFNSRAAGPYDRNNTQSRHQRWNSSGRLTPPPRGSGLGVQRGGNAQFSERGTVGPREAVQGRTLRSYEDLDAVSGAGNGELDY